MKIKTLFLLKSLINRVNPNFIHDLTPKLQALCAQFQELKEEAKRVGFISMEFIPTKTFRRLLQLIFVR